MCKIITLVNEHKSNKNYLFIKDIDLDVCMRIELNL